MNMDNVKSRLMTVPDWQSLTAYEMTKRVCAELTSAGEKIPSWTAIRDIIGKGSANDINRAKDDYRKQHGEDLRKMAGFVDGVPPELAPHILGFWSAAIACVKREYADHERAWESAVAEADERAAQADRQREEAYREREKTQAQLSGLQQANLALQQQLGTEQAARAQTERLFDQSRAEQATQREELRAALTQSQEQLNDAITRLEGVENHALRQVQDARDEARKKVEAAESKLKAQAADHTMDLNRVNRQLAEHRQQLAESNKSVALLEQDRNNWRERAERAESTADLLSVKASTQVEKPPSLRTRLRTQTQPGKPSAPPRPTRPTK